MGLTDRRNLQVGLGGVAAEEVMINRSTLAICMTAAMVFLTTIAFGQTRDAFGPVLPMVFDGQGGRHYCLYGYYGPFDPPIAPGNDYTTVVCPRKLAPTLRRAQEDSAGKARVQANALK